jgi:hypothetical protein
MAKNPDLMPVGDKRSFKFRNERLTETVYYFGGRDYSGSPFFTPSATRDTFDGTQFEGENHRRHTPYLQELWSQDRGDLIARIDLQSGRKSDRLFGSPISRTKFDVAIIGSGPHGAAVASYLREKRPDLRTVIIEGGDLLGGQWRSYGPNPVFQMNSRVRKADRRIPGLPRTEGSINPLGQYAPLELSDVVTSVYPWNTDMGDVCAINAWMSADEFLLNCKVTQVKADTYDYDEDGDIYGPQGNRTLTIEREDQTFDMTVRWVIDCTGLRSGSRIANETVAKTPGYFTAKTFYEHFGNGPDPLATFHDQNILLVGGGDSALTAIEALVGNLPSQTYGRAGIGRCRPKNIDWVGAARNGIDVIGCLRSRYKNGISQAIQRGFGDTCGIVNPIQDTVRSLRNDGSAFFEVRLNDRFDDMYPNIVIDCTNRIFDPKEVTETWAVNNFAGPNSGAFLGDRINNKIANLRIPENNVALWATMPATDGAALEICQTVLPAAKAKKK